MIKYSPCRERPEEARQLPAIIQNANAIQSGSLADEYFSQKHLPEKIKTKKCLAKIIGTGSFLPEKLYTISDLKRYFPQIDEEWTFNNIGVKTRYFARNFDSGIVSHTNSELTCLAAQKAMQTANISPEEIDLIVTTTASPDYIIPNMACMVQDKLGAKNAAALGIYSGCAGFVTALTTACQFIETGKSKIALVTGSELLSNYLDFNHQKCMETQTVNSTIFGDGAGAVILKSSYDGHGILTSFIGSDGKDNGPLILHDGGSKNRPTIETLKEGRHFWDLDFKAVITQSPRFMKESLKRVLEQEKIELNDIDWIIPHQPTLPITKRFFKKINFPIEKGIIYVDQVGNLASACIPVSLAMAVNNNKIKDGDLVLLVAAGAGWMFGACLIKW